MYEIEYARLSPTPSFVRRANDSEPFLEDNAEAILEIYDAFHKECYDDEMKCKEEYNQRKASFESKTCIACGGKLRFISSYEFWGCENYGDGLSHTTFNGKTPIYYNNRVRVGVNWLTDIIRTAGIEKHVKAKDLYNWLVIINQREDLYLKYTGTPSTKRIDGYVKTKIRSHKMEMEALEYLKTKFERVLYQQCITYKLKDKKEIFCIPDFICSKDLDVKVIDAKLDRTDDKKMQLYVELVKWIMRNNGDRRNVDGAHILYKVSTWSASNSEFEIIKLPQI